MGFAYKINNPRGTYFITFATVQWVDAFTRKRYVDIVLESIRYCQKEKGLRIHAWCIMSNHVHLIASTLHPKPTLSDILRDLKKFTSNKILEAIQDEQEIELEKVGCYGYLKVLESVIQTIHFSNSGDKTIIQKRFSQQNLWKVN